MEKRAVKDGATESSWLFEQGTYHEVLQRKLQTEGQQRGYRTLMARAAGCQPAYLSQVFSGSVQLTPEQASGLCDLWGYDELESDFFLTLVELGRSGTADLSLRLQRRLEKLRNEGQQRKASHLKVKGQKQKPKYSREKALHYYLDWIPSAVHVLLTIPGMDQPSNIAKRLRISETVALDALKHLVDLGLAERSEMRWRVSASMLHAADETLFAPHHHRNWREKAKEYFRGGKQGTNLHYTAVYSLDAETFAQIRELLDRAVKDSRRIVIPAPEKILACMNLDWFEI